MTATQDQVARKPRKNTTTKTSAESKSAVPKTTPDTPQTEMSAADSGAVEVNVNHTQSAPDEDVETRVARLFLEDYVTTSLLRQGRALAFEALEAASGVPDFSPNMAALRRALESSSRVRAGSGEWDLKLRADAAQKPRVERSRQPLEGTIEELLKGIGKPLPLPVIIREVAALRGVLPEVVRDGATHIVRATRGIFEVASGSWLHAGFLLDSELPSEALIIRENRLESNVDFRELRERDFTSPSPEASLSERAIDLLRQAARPLPQAVVGYFLWKQDAARGQASRFDARELAQALGDRAVFYPFAGGLISTQEQMATWRALAQSWLESQGPVKPNIAELLALALPADSLIAPGQETIAALNAQATAQGGQSVSLLDAMSDLLRIDVEDPKYVPSLQGLNAALQQDATWMAVGGGRFLLRSSVPRDVGTIPDILNPVRLEPVDSTGEAIDVEMTDEGLEGDCLEFVHAPQWEEIGEEVEVRLPRRDMSTHVHAESVRSVLLYPHHLAGTVKLRRIDDDFFKLEDAVSLLPIEARDEEGIRNLEAWADRNTGLIYNLVDWYSPRTPSSGAVLEFSRNEEGRIVLQLGAPDAQTHLDDDRVEALELMLETVESAPLFEILQALLVQHPQGAALPHLWAEINVLRRTTKRLMCSVLSAYQCFNVKQYGAKGSRWHFDPSKLDQGLKRNKSKFIRR